VSCWEGEAWVQGSTYGIAGYKQKRGAQSSTRSSQGGSQLTTHDCTTHDSRVTSHESHLDQGFTTLHATCVFACSRRCCCFFFFFFFLGCCGSDLVVRSHVRTRGTRRSPTGSSSRSLCPNYADQMGNKGAFIRFEAPDLSPSLRSTTRGTPQGPRPSSPALSYCPCSLSPPAPCCALLCHAWTLIERLECGSVQTPLPLWPVLRLCCQPHPNVKPMAYASNFSFFGF